MKEHHYTTQLNWTGNLGTGTSHYRAYSRNHEIMAGEKIIIPASSDPAFRGDPARYNPEELFVSSISSCHMLWYLHLAAVNGVVVLDYQDEAQGVMEEAEDGSGHFVSVSLNPKIVITTEAMLAKAFELHHEANRFCFIANSLNFKVLHKPLITIQSMESPSSESNH